MKQERERPKNDYVPHTSNQKKKTKLIHTHTHSHTRVIIIENSLIWLFSHSVTYVNECTLSSVVNILGCAMIIYQHHQSLGCDRPKYGQQQRRHSLSQCERVSINYRYPTKKKNEYEMTIWLWTRELFFSVFWLTNGILNN